MVLLSAFTCGNPRPNKSFVGENDAQGQGEEKDEGNRDHRRDKCRWFW